MSFLNPPERVTQEKVLALFQNELGYTYFGNLHERTDNRNLREAELTAFLQQEGHSEAHISRALYALQTAASKTGGLYHSNKAVYELLRYGATVTLEAGKHSDTVPFINWRQPERNHFGIAEEVTLMGENTRRPDLVLYINGIAVGVIELKRNSVSLTEAIGQCRSAQQDRFAESFFNTVQWVMAGNETEGLRYGTTGTPATHFLQWHEEILPSAHRPALYNHLAHMCAKARLLQLTADFILFDGGIKKVPRPHQFFATQKTVDGIHHKQGGIIWHTQGSGKSLTMVYIARRVLETMHDARIMVVTDRDELDRQIEGVFTHTEAMPERATSGHQLFALLALPQHRIITTLVHKFGRRGITDFQQFVQQLRQNPPQLPGRLVVFVDECHRTQSGRLHQLMKALLPGAVFIGFTGTPLLKADKAMSHEVFGTYIHTYKYNQAVHDKVVLDLQYEARDVEQLMASPDKVDRWFNAKTAPLNDFQKALLRKKWGTLNKVLSSASRMQKIVADITHDFATNVRLSSGRGNAMLVAGSIYQACRYYELLNERNSPFRGHCALVTSYQPDKRDITTQDMEDHSETEREYIYNTYTQLLNGRTTEEYEQQSKTQFLKEPAQMKLLIVVDKLLTGFDAPSCTFLYIDKHMQDHGLFQAICRVNRLDTDDKLFGVVIDYKGLFPKMTHAVSVYTSELDAEGFSPEECQVLLDDRRRLSRERLEAALEALERHCEAVPAPRSLIDYQRYFCGDMTDEEVQQTKTPLRHALYRLISSLTSAYNTLADGYLTAGYTKAEFEAIGRRVVFYTELFELLRSTANEKLDTRPYEADMRYMIDNYINASDTEVLASFENQGILELMAAVANIDELLDKQPASMRNVETMNEVVEQNIRLKISRDSMLNPAYYENISVLLQQVLEEEKRGAITARQRLEKMKELADKLFRGDIKTYPDSIRTKDMQTLYNNLGQDEALTLKIDEMLTNVCAHNWRHKDNTFNQQEIKRGLFTILQSREETERMYAIISNNTDY